MWKPAALLGWTAFPVGSSVQGILQLTLMCIQMIATIVKISKLTSALCLLGSLSAPWVLAAGHGGTFPDVIDVGTRPESITKGFGGDYFVTVMNGREEGDGVVKRIHGSEVSVFATGFDEPKGICFIGGYLITTDLNKVRKIDSRGNVSILADEDDFPVAISYLNDAAAGPDGKSVYITDMGANTKMNGPYGMWAIGSDEADALPVIGRVFEIGLDGSIRIAIDSNPLMPCPNGVGVGKDGQLLVGAFFTGNLLEQTDEGLRIVHDSMRGADAVEQDSEGYYYVSSWRQGRVWRVAPDGRYSRVLQDGFKSAADFYLEADKRRLLLPDMLAGTVNVIRW